VRAARLVAGRSKLDRRALWFQTLSLTAHAAILGATAVFMPPLAMAYDEGTTDDQVYALRQAMVTIAERERDDAQIVDGQAAPDSSPQGGEGARSKFEEGKMGSRASTAQNRRWGIAGVSPEVRFPKSSLEDARTFGTIGLVNAMEGAKKDVPTARWGGD